VLSSQNWLMMALLSARANVITPPLRGGRCW
jgi:hypothetical protein